MEELKKSLQNEKHKDSTIDQLKEEKVGGKENIYPTSKPKKIAVWFRNLRSPYKAVFIIGIIGFVFIIGIIVSLVFKLDSYIFPSSISGSITDTDNGDPMKGVKVCVGDVCTLTVENGNYVLGGLVYGSNTIEVSYINYHTEIKQVSLDRGRSEFDFTLRPTGYGILTGSLSSTMEEYDYSTISVLLDDEPLGIERNGAFTLSHIPVGSYKIIVSSSEFEDKIVNVSIEEEINSVGEITLVPAGDVVLRVVDWLSGEALQQADVTYDKSTDKTNKKGETKVVDLGLGKVKIGVSYEGYLKKNVTVNIEQGDNEKKIVRLAREGKVVYVSNRLGNNNIYISNYDGSEEIILSDDTGDSTSPYLSSDGTTVYFLSTREFIKDPNGYNNVPLVYSVSSGGGNISKVTQTQYEDVGSIGLYDFETLTRFYIKNEYVEEPWLYNSEIFFGSTAGNDMRSVTKRKGYMSNAVVTNDSTLLIYSFKGYTEDRKSGVYYVDVASGVTRIIMETGEDTAYPVDVSPNGNTVLIRRYDKQSSQWDLWIAGVLDGYSVRITNTSSQENQAMFSSDGSKVSYISNRDGRNDVYTIGVDGQNEEKITNDGAVDGYFWAEGSLLFFNSEKTMWVADVTSPTKARKVTDQVGATYYSEHYYYYD